MTSTLFFAVSPAQLLSIFSISWHTDKALNSQGTPSDFFKTIDKAHCSDSGDSHPPLVLLINEPLWTIRGSKCRGTVVTNGRTTTRMKVAFCFHAPETGRTTLRCPLIFVIGALLMSFRWVIVATSCGSRVHTLTIRGVRERLLLSGPAFALV